MAYCGYVTNLKNVRPHPNADKLVLADCFINTVCVAKDKYTEGQLGVYFPTDGQLDMEFCEKNGLLAVYENGINVSGGYMDPAKRNVKAIKLRGEKSDGLFLPLECLAYTGIDISQFQSGDQITVVNGKNICQKYIPKEQPRQRSAANVNPKKQAVKVKYQTTPTFFEHKDTEQLAYNLHMFKPGDEIEITLKMHGTSQRTGYHKVHVGYKRTLLDKILRRPGTPIYDWGYAHGTRRTVMKGFDGGFYGSNAFREPHAKKFEGKLWKGETVYYEVVGFTDTGTPIMSTCDNKKLKDKEFVKQYGDQTVFSYGCDPSGLAEITTPTYDGAYSVPKSDIYVYRMTMTNEDGDTVEYSPDFMRYRCELMGVKTVPVFSKITLVDQHDDNWDYGEAVKTIAEKYFDGPDPVGKTHIREGVVVRIVNRPTFTAYKHKNFNFKVLEGIIKEVAEAPDMEEADGLQEVTE
jgi:hypothetical protein